MQMIMILRVAAALFFFFTTSSFTPPSPVNPSFRGNNNDREIAKKMWEKSNTRGTREVPFGVSRASP